MNFRWLLVFLVLCPALLFAGARPVGSSLVLEGITCDLGIAVSCPGSDTSTGGSSTGRLTPAVFVTINEQFNPTTLSFLAFTGDVVLFNADGTVSDIVNFVGPPNTFTNTVFMYSNCDETPCESWDVPVPVGYQISANAVFGPEVGADPPAGAIYTVLNSDGSINTQYTIISDAAAVPEPSSLILLGTGLLGLVGGVRRKLS